MRVQIRTKIFHRTTTKRRNESWSENFHVKRRKKSPLPSANRQFLRVQEKTQFVRWCAGCHFPPTDVCRNEDDDNEKKIRITRYYIVCADHNYKSLYWQVFLVLSPFVAALLDFYIFIPYGSKWKRQRHTSKMKWPRFPYISRTKAIWLAMLQPNRRKKAATVVYGRVHSLLSKRDDL